MGSKRRESRWSHKVKIKRRARVTNTRRCITDFQSVIINLAQIKNLRYSPIIFRHSPIFSPVIQNNQLDLPSKEVKIKKEGE
jgi:hypothetical protein